MPLLPEDQSPALIRLRDGFALLVGLRWADYEPRPVAYSIRFAAAWCSVTFREAREGLQRLRDLDVIREAGSTGRITLYLPGEGNKPNGGTPS